MNNEIQLKFEEMKSVTKNVNAFTVLYSFVNGIKYNKKMNNENLTFCIDELFGISMKKNNTIDYIKPLFNYNDYKSFMEMLDKLVNHGYIKKIIITNNQTIRRIAFQIGNVCRYELTEKGKEKIKIAMDK